jgi:NADH-quinone oxidoreductase subunit F
METPLTKNITPDREPPDIKQYQQAGGYQALFKAIREMTPQEVQQAVKDSKLRGRGGAGFPTGMKWSFIPMGENAPHPKYLVTNADEMEPGTFKDRLLMEGDPHQLIEGMIVSSYATQVDVAYIFLRDEYKLPAHRLMRAVREAQDQGLLGKNILGSDFSLEFHIHTSAGSIRATGGAIRRQ